MATAAQRAKDSEVCFTDDGGSNQGSILEALNLASVSKLPEIFVFEDNSYAETTASSWAGGSGHVLNRPSAFGMPGPRAGGEIDELGGSE